jgi:hypothetical protein
MAEGLAIFLQFQDQIAGLVANLDATTLTAVQAIQYFLYLPAAGFLPITGGQSAIGFSYQMFLSGHTYRDPIFIEGSVIKWLLGSSYYYAAIDLSNPEMIRLYSIRENIEGIDQGSGAFLEYLIFCNGHIPYLGNARYDLNYWNYADYAERA